MSSELTIVALDPGEMTGFAVCRFSRVTGNSFEAVRSALTSSGQIWSCGCGDFLCNECSAGEDELVSLIEEEDPGVLVVESFQVRGGAYHGKVLTPVRVIQSLVALYRWGCIVAEFDMVMQTASQGKGKATDDRLKKYELWGGHGRHERDAIRHMVAYVDREVLR